MHDGVMTWTGTQNVPIINPCLAEFIWALQWWARWRLESPASPLFTQPFIQAKIKENIKLRVTGLCAGNSAVTGEFPSQMASNAENVSIWWRHHGKNVSIWWRHHGKPKHTGGENPSAWETGRSTLILHCQHNLLRIWPIHRWPRKASRPNAKGASKTWRHQALTW